jgi:hypothetical protein
MEKCAHEGCGCDAQPGDQHCSDYCRGHAAHAGDAHECECGHTECHAA